MSAAPITRAELRTIDLLDDLDEDQLGEWLNVAHARAAEPGDLMADQGQESPGTFFLLAGKAQTLLVQGEHTEPLGRQEAPTWTFAITTLTGGSVGVRLVAETACRFALIEPGDFRRLALAQPAVHQRVMQQVAPVMSRLSAIEYNRERLESLGTMAAGLAHELNNPAAAARRAAAQLADAIDVVGAALGRFVESGIERVEAEELLALQREALAGAAERTALDTLDAADAEDDLLDRLEALDVPEAWRMAEPLAAAGVDDAWLDRVAALAGPATDAAVGWVAATLTAQGLAAELQESTQRMSDLVGVIKTYAYMDRGELVEVDLHEGLETTLAILGHKLKHTEIDVVRDYDRGLPKLTVRGSELNQVWTNLLDNAIDALGDAGTISISTRRDSDGALVEISDDGPGIDPAIRDRIFDEFFTTKDVGRGTGLGLATAQRIVVDRHDGSLRVASEPARTTFRVRLPFTQSSPEGPHR